MTQSTVAGAERELGFLAHEEGGDIAVAVRDAEPGCATSEVREKFQDFYDAHEEKALGNIEKTRTTPVADALAPAQRPAVPGLNFTDTSCATTSCATAEFITLTAMEYTLSEAGDRLDAVIDRTVNGRLTCAEVLGHREFALTRLFPSA